MGKYENGVSSLLSQEHSMVEFNNVEIMGLTLKHAIVGPNLSTVD